MEGYLLDTNIVRFWFDPTRSEHVRVRSRIEALPEDAPMMISAITLGEIEYGHRALGESGDPEQERDFLEFVQKRLPTILNVERHTRIAYGSLRARLFEKYAPKDRRKKGLRPEQLIDPTTAKELGIQENDLWIAAQALEHNLVLVSHDKMTRLRKVAEELRVQDWAKEP